MMNPKQDCMTELKKALESREHGWRTGTLANIDQDLQPQARTVVIRDVDVNHGSIFIFTDVRSPKVTQLKANPRATLVLWCPNIQQQLRLSCSVSEVHNTSDYWRQIAHSRARIDYATKYAPGSPLNADLTMNESLAEQNFCVLQLNVETIDRLWISQQGHRRQRIGADSVIDICP
jgi:pyridoxamine 5'-phosphate oxidase